METMAHGFVAMLGDYPAEKVKKAFMTHVQREEELPTLAGIINLIKRNGRPPLKESDVIAARKKHGEDRTKHDWQIIREWDALQSEEWDASPQEKAENQKLENAKLRQEIMELRKRNDALMTQGYIDQQAQKAQEAVRPTFKGMTAQEAEQARHERTINEMKKRGATDDEILEYWEWERKAAEMRGDA
jgi:hypothetical protein